MKRPKLDEQPPVSPGKLAHIVLRSKDIDATRDWYMKVLNARVMFQAGGAGVGLTYDSEHHRIALTQMTPEEVREVEEKGDIYAQVDAQQRFPGLAHVAFTYDTLGDLLANYKRLKREGIEPTLCINHGPTTSMYYMDPDGNGVELQHDNMPMDQAYEFVLGPEFRDNQVGYPYDPDELCDRYEAGEPLADLVMTGWKEAREMA